METDGDPFMTAQILMQVAGMKRAVVYTPTEQDGGIYRIYGLGRMLDGGLFSKRGCYMSMMLD